LQQGWEKNLGEVFKKVFRFLIYENQTKNNTPAASRWWKDKTGNIKCCGNWQYQK